MADLYQLYSRPELHEPVLLVALEGWIDAGLSANVAANALITEANPVTIAAFDTDRLIDFRARRPILHLRDGVNTGLTWPFVEVRHTRNVSGRDLLMLVGHEPDMHWHAFVAAVVGLSGELGVQSMVGFGAYPFATPHTRPSRLSITANTPDLAGRLPYLRNSLDVPAGVEAALERRFFEVSVPAVGLWAQVPHYVSNMPYPPASVALIDGLGDLTGMRFAVPDLRQQAAAHAGKLDQLVARSDEHVDMLRQLEEAFDADTQSAHPAAPQPAMPPAAIPSGDELAAELERFLREQGDG